MTGLTLLAGSFGWIAVSPAFMPYGVIVGQMILMGLGLGMTTAPATESIPGALPPANAGIGSAVDDATRETGGTLGVAVLGSIFTPLYAGHLPNTAFRPLPGPVLQAGQESVAAALSLTRAAPAGQQQLLDAVQDSFMWGFHVACGVAAGVCLLGVLGAALLPGRPGENRLRESENAEVTRLTRRAAHRWLGRPGWPPREPGAGSPPRPERVPQAADSRRTYWPYTRLPQLR
ncbi:hypothetical protein [Streptomyces sp. NPDC093089]|uniref:hypothetical protein n=1 Tax=Streptomyces sp. NPDC093089 TaxID=3366024 RepID=UPI003810FED5